MTQTRPIGRHPVWGIWLSSVALFIGWLCDALFLFVDGDSHEPRLWLIGAAGVSLFVSGLFTVIFWRHWIEVLRRASKRNSATMESDNEPGRWPFRLSPLAFRYLALSVGASYLLIGTLWMVLGL